MSTDVNQKMTIKERIFRTISPESKGYKPSKIFNSTIIILILINMVAIIADTFSSLPEIWRSIFYVIEVISVAVFSIEYLLRLWTADMFYPKLSPVAARFRYVFSIAAIIDILAVLPFYVPYFFSVDLIALRMLRLLHLIRVFEPNSVSSPFWIIESVIRKKARQIMSAIIFAFTLMVVTSILMYSTEHQVQPEVFRNAFSGIRWVLTNMIPINYGEIHLVTEFGKFLGIIMTLLALSVVILPIGIISSGFVEEQGAIHVKNLKLTQNPTEEINRLFELKEKGVLSKDEFESKKKELLSRI